ncbi:MAG: dethiobiotin synthase [Leptospirales bacterium]|nr:dethiobiotin synthase [Leptospirales bacterium]
MKSVFVTGVDTGIGKTVSSAALLRRYQRVPGLRYWKPVQTGADDDRLTVARLSGLGDRWTAPTLYRFEAPLSPHRAAELEDATIDADRIQQRFKQHCQSGPLIIEGAGGIMTPLTRQLLWLDLLQQMQIPAVVATRTGLGTINHSLLTLHALRLHNIPIAGLIFCGEANDDNVRTILEMGDSRSLGRFFYAPSLRFDPQLDLDGLLAEALDWPDDAASIASHER